MTDSAIDQVETLSSCEGKEAFATIGRAQEVAKRGRQRKNTNVQPYRCLACHQWHIGSSIRRRSNR